MRNTSKTTRVAEFVDLKSYELKVKIVQDIRKVKKITPKEIMETYGISNNTTHLYLKELVKAGCLVRCFRGIYKAGDNPQVPLNEMEKNVEDRRKRLSQYFRNHPNEIVSSKDLSKLFNVSDKTIRNDIMYVRDIAIETIHRRGYKYISD
ncbi:MAG: helix-turn-helix domain-containing protein [Eubacterium sp.]|jgi:DeoR/GlpR family transcriptional regulator of sugar metabolism|nr:helix-turn-helix domain-containing protein [Eubacterium sp.]